MLKMLKYNNYILIQHKFCKGKSLYINNFNIVFNIIAYSYSN